LRQQRLDRLLSDTLGNLPSRSSRRGTFLDAADIAGVIVIDFLFAGLFSRQHDRGGIADDDGCRRNQRAGCRSQILPPRKSWQHDEAKPADHEAIGTISPISFELPRLCRKVLNEPDSMD